jgi:glycosyltransferase involved in cell wall biosynthesis
MNVWILCNRFPVVSESFILRQVHALAATVYTKVVDHSLDIPRGINVVELPRPTEVRSRGDWARRAQQLWQAMRYGNTVLMHPCTERAFSAALAASKPDVVLAHFGATGLQAMRPCAKAKVPLVVHFHGIDLSKAYRDRWYRFSYGRLVDTARALVVVNNVQRERLMRLGAPPEKVFVIPCGVPVNEFLPCGRVSEQPCRFIAVGRLVAKKSPGNTIRAFAECRHACPDVSLAIIGDGPLRNDCQRLANDLDVLPHIRFMGAQPVEVVRREVSDAGVFVQHSLTNPDGDEEGWPVAIGEAMACALPIVSTRHAGITDQVVEEETGFLVDEGDWSAMARRMKELADNPELRRRMGVAGRHRIEKIGDFENSIRLLKDVLAKV